MKFGKREPLGLSASDPKGLMAEPDNDLDLPALELSPMDSLGAVTPAAQEITAAPIRHRSTGLQPRSGRIAVAAPAFGAALYWLALAASIIWAILSVFAVGYQGPLSAVEFQPYQIAVFVVLAITPIAFFWIAAYCLRQGARLAAEVVRTKAIAEELLSPAALAIVETGSAVESVRAEIQSAAAAATTARTELLSLREALAQETDKLAKASEQAARTSHTLSGALGNEREAMSSLVTVLESRATAVADAITRQAKMVAEASDLAQTQIGEAEAALAARAADLTAAAGDAGQASRLASEDLARQVSRLETATIGVSDQIRTMEDTLTQQRGALVAVSNTVRADHEDFSVKIESQRAQLAEVLANAQMSVADLHEAALAAADTVSEFSDSAATHTRQLAEAAKTERDLLSASALQSLGAVSETARYEREALETDIDRSLEVIAGAAARERGAIEDGARSRMAALADAARAEREALEAGALRGLDTMTEAAETASRLADGYNEAARKRIEELSEAAAASNAQAEAAFQARLSDANALIAKSAGLVDDASARSLARIEDSAAQTREVLAALENVMADFEARVAKLPAQTQSQAEHLKATIASGFSDMLASARTAAEETQAIDQAFQDRVRRNYEMLSEAVRLMGVVSNRPNATSGSFAPPPAPRPAPPLEIVESEVRPSRMEESEPDKSAPARDEPRQRLARRPFPFAPRPAASEPDELRSRLKLSPTTADVEVSQVFEKTAEAAPAEAVGWSWQELLSSMDDSPIAERQLVEQLIGEIEVLGVDLSAILPPARIDEIAAVIEAGDFAGARAVVRHLAPAAVRRLSRRLMSETGLRAQAEGYLHRHAEAIDAARKGDAPAGSSLSTLLSKDEGRAYLLFDAAFGDVL